jgi:eukaryotic-like serine/threonine-protein kinase
MGTKTRLRLPRSPFLDAVRKSGLLTPDDLVAFITQNDVDEATLTDPIKLAAALVRKKLLTKFQAMQLLHGKTQGFKLGHYTILDGIRQDRVGMVFRATDERTKKQVSLKVLPTDRASDPTILRAFADEVRKAATVQHPNVARVLDLAEWCGTYFVVTELPLGQTLDKVLANGPLPADKVGQYAAQVAIALKAAHAAGLVHRDIKPGNIAVAPDGSVKLIDLGLTHMLENPWKQVTKRIKTQEYADEITHIAPEQAWGCEPDARSDVYSLGSTLFHLLTGRPPFPGTATEQMAERQIADIPAPSSVRADVPRDLDQIVCKMGAKEPHLRYPNANELIKALHGWLPVTQWAAIAGTLEMTPLTAERTAVAAPAAAKGGPPAALIAAGVAAAALAVGVAALLLK